MRLTVDFSALEDLVRRMCVHSIDVELENIEQILPVAGRPINARGGAEAYGVGTYNLLSYEGDFVAIYIKYWRRDDLATMLASEMADSAQGRPKYHIAECRTIEEMRETGRYVRFVASRRTSGVFSVRANDQVRDWDIRLQVCKNCLAALDWQSYSRRDGRDRSEARKRFSLEKFWAKCRSHFLWWPTDTDEV